MNNTKKRQIMACVFAGSIALAPWIYLTQNVRFVSAEDTAITQSIETEAKEQPSLANAVQDQIERDIICNDIRTGKIKPKTVSSVWTQNKKDDLLEELNSITYDTVPSVKESSAIDEAIFSNITVLPKIQRMTIEAQNTPVTYKGNHITRTSGTCKGPSGRETYYNLKMDGVISAMRRKGYSEEDYPYWVRSDGAKMLGPYIMVAANLQLRPKGTILECSLGMAIVCDTGPFAKKNQTQLDIAVNW